MNVLLTKGKKIILIADYVNYSENPRDCDIVNMPIRKLFSKIPNLCSPSRKKYTLPGNGENLLFLENLANINKNIVVYDPNKFLCNGLECDIKINGNHLYNDSNHLSPDGIKVLTRGLPNLIKSLLLSK